MSGIEKQIIYKLNLESDKVLNVESIIIEEHVGLSLPILKVQFAYPTDKFSDLALGKTIKVQLGDEDLEWKMQFTIVGHEFKLDMEKVLVQLVGMYRPEFNVKTRGRVFKNKNAVEALQAILSDYFSVESKALPTDDRMTWVQLAMESDRDAALRIWKHSYYGGINHLLPYILSDGRAILIDYQTASQQKPVELGDTLDPNKGSLSNYSVFNTKSSVMDYLSAFKVAARELKTAAGSSYTPSYSPVFSIGDAPDTFKELSTRYQVYFKGVTHDNYHTAVAKNSQAFSKLDALRVQVQLRTTRLKDIVDLAKPVNLKVLQRDQEARAALLELGGKYIVLGRSLIGISGQPLMQLLHLAKDAFSV